MRGHHHRHAANPIVIPANMEMALAYLFGEHFAIAFNSP
jgi:hypothetical protein